MEFQEWTKSSGPVEGLLSAIFNKAKTKILASAQSSDGVVKFSFPDEYVYFAISTPALFSQPAYTLSQQEGYLQQDPYGKVGLALKAAPDFAQTLSNSEQKQFLDLKGSIQTISKPLGLLFEIEVFFYLNNNKQLEPRGGNTPEILTTKWKEQYEIIERRIGDYLADLVVRFARHHAADLGESIYARTIKLLNCKVDYIVFTGGELYAKRQVSDIALGCSAARGRSNIGYSIKFTSETAVPIAHIRVVHGFALLGGKNIAEFSKTVNGFPTEDRKIDFVLDTYADLARDLNDHPVKLNRMINRLLFGIERSENPSTPAHISDNLLAFRNYVKNRGDTAFTNALRQDFNISYLPGQKLSVKHGATIDVRRKKAYVIINIKGPDSRTGTNIKFQIFRNQFETKHGQVEVKMNNLT